MTFIRALMFLACCVAAVGTDAAAATKPNIVFFLVDDMGWQETSVPFHSEVTALNRRYRTPKCFTIIYAILPKTARSCPVLPKLQK